MSILILALLLAADPLQDPVALTPETERELMIMGYSILPPLQSLRVHVEDLSVLRIRETLANLMKTYPNMVYIEACEIDEQTPWAAYSRHSIPLEKILAENRSWACEQTRAAALPFTFQQNDYVEFCMPVFTQMERGIVERYFLVRFGMVLDPPADQRIRDGYKHGLN